MRNTSHLEKGGTGGGGKRRLEKKTGHTGQVQKHTLVCGRETQAESTALEAWRRATGSLAAAPDERKVRVKAYLAIHPALLPHVDVRKIGGQGQGADVADKWQPRRTRGEARRPSLPQELADHQHEQQQKEGARERPCARLGSG